MVAGWRWPRCSRTVRPVGGVLAVWVAAVRLRLASGGRHRGRHGGSGDSRRADTAPGRSAAIAVTLFCLLLAVTGQFIRRSREARTQNDELLMAQLQDARDAEAAAAALAERGRIAGELHDVLAHALSAARRDRAVSGPGEGLTQARQAVGALRGSRRSHSCPSDGFRRDTGTDVSLATRGVCVPRTCPRHATRRC